VVGSSRNATVILSAVRFAGSQGPFYPPQRPTVAPLVVFTSTLTDFGPKFFRPSDHPCVRRFDSPPYVLSWREN